MGHGKPNLSQTHRDRSSRRRPSAGKSFTDAGEAVRALQGPLRRATPRSCAIPLLQLAEGGEDSARYRAFYPELGVSTTSYAQVDTRVSYGHVPAPGHYLDDDHPARPVRKLSARAARADHPQPRRAGHRVGIDDADPAALRLRRRHPCRGSVADTHQAAAARPVRRAGPQRHRRPHRQRHVRGDARRAAAAGAVHRAAHRLFAAPAVALHGDQPAAFPELRAVHQLPVLHRRILRPRARADGQGRRRLHRLRRAGQRHHAGRRERAAGRRRRRRACRRCRPIT